MMGMPVSSPRHSVLQMIWTCYPTSTCVWKLEEMFQGLPGAMWVGRGPAQKRRVRRPEEEELAVGDAHWLEPTSVKAAPPARSLVGHWVSSAALQKGHSTCARLPVALQVVSFLPNGFHLRIFLSLIENKGRMKRPQL